MKNLKYVIFFVTVLILLFAISYPAYKYFEKLGSGLSGKNADWAAFGSYIGGVYSSIFSFFSVVILSFTLYFTQKNNSEQIKLIKQDGTLKEFSLLMENLLHHLSSEKNFPVIMRNENNFIYRLSSDVYEEMLSDPSINFDTALKKHITENLNSLYNDEAKIITKLDSTILMLPKDLHDTYRTIFKTKISNERRFILKKYMEYFNFDVKGSMISENDFCDMPKELAELKVRMDAVY
jgi:hypothetical protein